MTKLQLSTKLHSVTSLLQGQFIKAHWFGMKPVSLNTFFKKVQKHVMGTTDVPTGVTTEVSADIF